MERVERFVRYRNFSEQRILVELDLANQSLEVEDYEESWNGDLFELLMVNYLSMEKDLQQRVMCK